MRKRIAVLGANDPLLPFYKQTKALGYEIIGIAIPDGAVCREYCVKFYPVSFADKEKVVEICRKENVDGITSFSLESALPTIAYVCEKLGLVGNSQECVNRTASKFCQRKTLEKAGIPVPKYFLIDNEQQLLDVNCNFPIIVKPTDSGGSQGISKVDDASKILEAYRYAKNFSKSKKVIIEEFVDGREFSVEYISHKGKHYFLQITDKVTSGSPRFVEMQHHQPAEISVELKNQIKRMVENALNALHIENSASHTEIKLNSQGKLYIIETGARMGGDYISSDLVRLSTGYDFVDGTLKLAIGKFEEPKIINDYYSGVYFYSKLARNVGEYILSHKDDEEVVDWSYSSEPLNEVRSNSDRRGHLIYQKIGCKKVL